MISRSALWATSFSCALASLVASHGAHAADPTKKECVDANESGQDLRQAGKLQEARAALSLCMAQRCPRPVREDCAQRLSEIEAVLPTLVFVAKDAQGNDLSGVLVTMDGLSLGASDGTAVAVDPGNHDFTFEKNGLPAVRSVIVVREGDKNRRVQVVLGVAVAPLESSPPATARAAASPSPTTGSTGLFGLRPSTERGLGIGIGAAGVAGLALGTVFGFLSKSTYDHAVQECPGGDPGHCSAKGNADGQTAYAQATTATVAFIVGGGLLAGGAVLYFATPSGSVALSPTAAYRGGGLDLRGGF